MKAPGEQQSNFLLGVCVAQLSVLAAALGGSSMELLGHDARPVFIVTCCYGLLALSYGGYRYRCHGFRLSAAWWKYALLALNDALAFCCTMASLNYTSVTSWALIQPASLLSAVPLSIFFLNASYRLRHLLSGLLAFAGLVLLLFSDVDGESHRSGDSALMTLFGDAVALVGASLYGVTSIVAEMLIKSGVSQYEVMGLLGLFGTVFGAIASLALGEISTDTFPDTRAAFYTLVAIFSNFSWYVCLPVVLCSSGAAVLCISLLGTNFWSVLGKLFIIGGFHTNVIGFGFALAMVITGVVLFTLSGDPYAKHSSENASLETEQLLAATHEDVSSSSGAIAVGRSHEDTN